MNARVTLPELERDVVRVARSIHGRGWAAHYEGNVTALTSEGRILATPASTSLGVARESDLVLLDRFGRKVSGSRDVFAELPMHLAVYQGRDDVGAVVHGHPTAATAFAVAGLPIEAGFLPEFLVCMGGTVPVVPFGLPGSEALNGAIVPFLERFDVVLLQNHGVLAWGPDPDAALLRMEHVEAAARILMDVRTLGGPTPLSPEVIQVLMDDRSRAGLGPSGRARARSRPSR